MERIPREILDTLEDLYKTHSVSPRDFPGVHIHWQGCGDSGGIEEINFLTPQGVKYSKQYGSAPPIYQTGENGPGTYYLVKPKQGHDGITRNSVVYVGEGNDYTLGQFIYERFDVCEINDGGYAHAFIEMPQGKMWGESWDWVHEERINTSIAYEN